MTMYQAPVSTVLNAAVSNSPAPQAAHRSASSIFKRCLDIVGSLIGLLYVSRGSCLPVALAIKLDDPGPIFYSQERYGLQGRTFRIKFRSMVVNADQLKTQVMNEASGLIFKNKQDPRVTRVVGF